MVVRHREPLAKKLPLQPRVKVWLEMDDQYVFGFGISEILKAVRDSGSMKAAATSLGKSYRHVWARIKEAEQALGSPLVDTRRGGKGDSRSSLTMLAGQLVDDYDALRLRMMGVVQQEFSARFKRALDSEEQVKDNGREQPQSTAGKRPPAT